MSLIVSAAEGKTFEPLEEGTYLGVCFMLVDLGMIWSEEYKKASRRVELGWEVPIVPDDPDGEVKIFRLYREYSASLNEKSNLRKDLASWRSRDFTKEELAAFDLKNIVGVSCFLSVTNKEGKDGKVYNNVKSVMALPKGTPKAELSGDPVIFDLDTDPLGVIETFPKFIADKIKKSQTYEDRLAADLPELEDLGTGDPGEDLPF